jgi:hypothetical protein
MAHPTDTEAPAAFRWVFMAFTFALAVNIGAALLASTVIFPVWSASPAAARAWTGEVNEAAFFMRVSPAVLLLAVASLLMSRRVPVESRRWIRMSAGLYLLFFAATLAYFVPGQEALHGAGGASIADAELSSRLQTWVALNWVRQAVGAFALGAALYALTLSHAHRPLG